MIGTIDDNMITATSGNTQWDCIKTPHSQECPLLSTASHKRKPQNSHESQAAAREPSKAACKWKNKLITGAEKQESCIHLEPQEIQRQVEQKTTALSLLGDAIELECSLSEELPPDTKNPRVDITIAATTNLKQKKTVSSQSRFSNMKTKEEDSSLPEIVKLEPSSLEEEELPPQAKSPKLDRMTKESSQRRSYNVKKLTFSEGVTNERKVEGASFPDTEEIIELDSTSLEELPLFARLLYKKKQKSTPIVECSNSIDSVSETSDCVVTSSCTSLPLRQQSRNSCGSSKMPIIID